MTRYRKNNKRLQARDEKPVTRDELHLAWARVPNTAGVGGGFDAALKNEAVNHCLTNMVYLMRNKYGSQFSKFNR